MSIFLPALLLASMLAAEPESDLAALKEKARAALTGDRTHSFQHMDDAVAYAAALAAAGQDDEALKWYQSCTKYFPWRMDCQFGAADILKKKGDIEGAKNILVPLLRYMESDADYVRACRELGQPVDAELPLLAKLPGTSHAIVIVPVGETDPVLVKEAAAEASNIIGIPVLVQHGGLALPEPKIDGWAIAAEHIATGMKEDAEFREFVLDHLASKKFKEAQLAEPEACRLILTKIMEAQEVPFDTIQAELEQTANFKQWFASDLIELVDKRTFAYHRPNVYYLGITKADLTSPNYSFVFSNSRPGCAIDSYCRMTAPWSGGAPDRQRLARRIRITLLQSIGKMFDLDVCSDPSCPVSYQNSLIEHDAKSEQYCQKCNATFQEAVKKAALPQQTWTPAAPPPMGLRF